MNMSCFLEEKRTNAGESVFILETTNPYIFNFSKEWTCSMNLEKKQTS